LQKHFCDALLTAEAPDPAFLSELQDDGLALQRFQVYRNNFIVLNGDAIADMYPVVKRLLGDEAFRILATAYVRNYPPSDRTLLLYGEAFADFLASIPELSELGYLSDVARLEYAWTAAYHALDVETLKPDQITELSDSSFEHLKLRPHPSIQFLESKYPVYRIWTLNQTDDQDEVISLDEGPSSIVVIRPDTDVEVREVTPGEMEFLKRLCDFSTLGEANAQAQQIDPEFNLERFFINHLFDGTFCTLGEESNLKKPLI
jgi:hypothetical protein